MRAFSWTSSDAVDPSQLVDAIICQEVTLDRARVFHKGHRISADDLPVLARVEETLHLVQLEPGDVHEDLASARLSRALTGPGVVLTEPRLSRVNATARTKGLLRVDQNRLLRANCAYGVSVFTLPDRLAVLPGRVVAGFKIAPVAIEDAILSEIETFGRGSPVVDVKPFLPIRVGVVSTEGLEGRVRDRFQRTVRAKIGWYGGEVLGFEELPDRAASVGRAIEAFIEAGAGLILTGGGNTIDPLDPAIRSLAEIGAEMVKFGAPAHPGSMFWLAYRGDVPIFNLASCSMYSAATSADLILPWIMAGERVTVADVAELGFGGLLEGKEMSFRFPPYDRDTDAS